MYMFRGHIDKLIGLYQLLRNELYVFFAILIVKWFLILLYFRAFLEHKGDKDIGHRIMGTGTLFVPLLYFQK